MIENIFLAMGIAVTPFFGTVFTYRYCKADDKVDKLGYFIMGFLLYTCTIWSIFNIVDSKLEKSEEELFIKTTTTTTTTETTTIPTTITDDDGNIYVLQTTSAED